MNLNTYLQWSGAAPVLVALVFLALCTVVGLAALSGLMGRTGAAHREMGDWSVPLRVFVAATLGMCLLIFALFLLALAGQLHTHGVAAAVGVALAAALLRLWQDRGGARRPWLKARDPWWAGAALALALLLWLVWRSVQPPGLWDDTMYQLPQARLFAQSHALAVDPYLRFPLFPYNANLLFAAALLFGNEVDAQVIATLPLFLVGLGLLGLGRYLTGTWAVGWLAVALLAHLGPVHEALGYAYVDQHLALYVWAGIVMLVLALRAPPKSAPQARLLLLCGVFLGTAAGTKFFGLVMAGWLLVIMVLNFRQLGSSWRWYVLAGCVFGLGWYVRSAMISGDPVHPMGGAWFGHYLWNAEDLAAARAEQATHGAGRGWLSGWAALQTAGLLPLAPALLAFLVPSLRTRVWCSIYAAFGGYLLFWFFTSQVSRYTAPMLAVGVFLSAAVLHAAAGLLLGRWAHAFPAFRLRAVVTWGVALGFTAVVLQHGHQAFQRQAATWNTTLMSRPGYELFSKAGAMAPQHGPVLLQLGYENAVYFFGGMVAGDWFGTARYAPLLKCAERCEVAGPEALADAARRHGARMVAVHAKRFHLEPAAYQSHFSVLHTSRDGVLLLLRP
jgi:hypothetical protein